MANTIRDLAGPYCANLTNVNHFRNTHWFLQKMLDFFKDRNVNDIFKADIEAFFYWRNKITGRPSTASWEVTMGRRFYEWLEDKEKVDHNPFTELKRIQSRF